MVTFHLTSKPPSNPNKDDFITGSDPQELFDILIKKPTTNVYIVSSNSVIQGYAIQIIKLAMDLQQRTDFTINVEHPSKATKKEKEKVEEMEEY